MRRPARRRPGAHGGEALRRLLPPLLVGLLLSGLCLTALRVDLQRVGYALMAAKRERSALLDERNALAARVGTLRHPARLARLARERGFARPERVIHLGPVRTAAASRPADARPDTRPARP